MAGAERVGPQPLQQVKVLDNQRPIKSLTPNLQHISKEKEQRNESINADLNLVCLPTPVSVGAKILLLEKSFASL